MCQSDLVPAMGVRMSRDSLGEDLEGGRIQTVLACAS
jgi:hypothetical protein